MTPERRPWDVDLTMSKAALERYMRALVVVRGHFTDSMTLYGDPLNADRSVSLFTRTWIPDGRLAEFQRLARPEGVRPPARMQVGMASHECPECDERCPQGHHGGSEWKDVLGD